MERMVFRDRQGSKGSKGNRDSKDRVMEAMEPVEYNSVLRTCVCRAVHVETLG